MRKSDVEETDVKNVKDVMDMKTPKNVKEVITREADEAAAQHGLLSRAERSSPLPRERRGPLLGSRGGAALLGAAAATGLFLLGFSVARAGEPASKSLTFAGTLTSDTGTPLGGERKLTFDFRRPEATESLCSPPPTVTAHPDPATGAFSVSIPLAACDAALFDGQDVVYDVLHEGEKLAEAQPVGWVPYATLALRAQTSDRALQADAATRAERAGTVEKPTQWVEVGTVTATFHEAGWTLHDHPSDPNAEWRTYIAFEREFASIPDVVVSLNSLDTSNAVNTRVGVGAVDVTTEGFTFVASTYAGSLVYVASSSWVAVGTPK